jgi:hypothetical protein
MNCRQVVADIASITLVDGVTSSGLVEVVTA